MAFSQVGYYLVSYQAQQQRKQEIKELLRQDVSEHLLTVIDYTTNHKNIFWEEEGKEFFFEGELYDLVNTKSIKGKIYFYCFNDGKEKELIENLNSISNNDSAPHKKLKTTFENVISPYILVPLYFSYSPDFFPDKNPSAVPSVKMSYTSIALKPPQVS